MENVREMSSSEERPVQQQPQPQEAEPLNMSVWTHRILVRHLNPRTAEYVSFCYRTALNLEYSAHSFDCYYPGHGVEERYHQTTCILYSTGPITG